MNSQATGFPFPATLSEILL